MNYTGICDYPFLQEDFFPSVGGFIKGRYCQESFTLSGDRASCCVPCPVAPWKYGDHAVKRSETASWLSVVLLPLLIFLLVSYAVLHPKWTRRHYLSVCFTLGICCMEVAFIIPLGIKPDECYNAITPKDMRNDVSCAFTGALLLFGGWMVVVWSFLRTLAFHLQVCWEMILGTKFMWFTLITGWGVPVIGLTVMLVLTGVSYRFGKVCHINIDNSTNDYWIPVLVFAVAALVLQLATMAYCIHVYIKTLFNRDLSTNSEGLPSYAASVRSINARQAYRRIRKVFRLQWRGVALVFVVIASAILYAAVFIKLDKSTENTPETLEKALPWLLCLAITQGDKEKCKNMAKGFGPDEHTILAVVVLLSLNGLWNFILFARPSLFLGWVDLFKRICRRDKEFICADSRTLLPNSADTRAYEMVYSSAEYPSCKSPDAVARSPTPDRAGDSKNPYEDWEGERIKKPPMSVSTPRPAMTRNS